MLDERRIGPPARRSFPLPGFSSVHNQTGYRIGPAEQTRAVGHTLSDQAMRERTGETVESISEPLYTADRKEIRRRSTSSSETPTRPRPAAQKMLVVEFRSGEAVHRHPALTPYLCEGWEIESAVPRLSDVDGVELLVVMSRSAVAPESSV